jgi:multicomponent Na+:H+ antiporter subunit E
MKPAKKPLPLRLFRLAEFSVFYVFEVVVSNLRVAQDILTPRHRMDPAFVEIELEPMTDWQLTVLANLITMTPGTLSMDIHPETRNLYVHAMYVGDPEEFRKKIKHDYERRILNVF